MFESFVHKDPLSSAIFLTAVLLPGTPNQGNPNDVMNFCETIYDRLRAIEERAVKRDQK